MGLFDVFSDWGVASWQEDVGQAHAQAVAWIAQTSKAKTWTSQWSDTAYDLAATAEDISDTAEAYWKSLLAAWKGYRGPSGWDSLGEAFASAGHASYTAATSRDEGSVASVVKGTVAKTTDDLKTMADPTKSVVPWIVALVAIGGGYVYLKSARIL